MNNRTFPTIPCCWRSSVGVLALMSQLTSSPTSAQPMPETVAHEPASAASVQFVELKGDAGGKRFDGIGVVNGGPYGVMVTEDFTDQ